VTAAWHRELAAAARPHLAAGQQHAVVALQSGHPPYHVNTYSSLTAARGAATRHERDCHAPTNVYTVSHFGDKLAVRGGEHYLHVEPL
jgi:hypothetical protein